MQLIVLDRLDEPSGCSPFSFLQFPNVAIFRYDIFNFRNMVNGIKVFCVKQRPSILAVVCHAFIDD